MRKECIKLGLSGRFTMKEALVEIATALVRIGKDPRVHQFHTSQPLLGYYPYQVVISSEIIETMKVLPTTLSSAGMTKCSCDYIFNNACASNKSILIEYS